MITSARTWFVGAALVLGASCGGESEGPPAAPSGLSAMALSGGAHLTWIDNADNEVEFMVMRMQVGVDAELLVIETVPFDTTQYHDAPLTSGQTYMYSVMAMNHSGESLSETVTFAAP